MLTSLAPLLMATMTSHELSSMGHNYMKTLFAVGFQGLLIMVSLAIYAISAEYCYRPLYRFFSLGAVAVPGVNHGFHDSSPSSLSFNALRFFALSGDTIFLPDCFSYC